MLVKGASDEAVVVRQLTNHQYHTSLWFKRQLLSEDYTGVAIKYLR